MAVEQIANNDEKSDAKESKNSSGSNNKKNNQAIADGKSKSSFQEAIQATVDIEERRMVMYCTVQSSMLLR